MLMLFSRFHPSIHPSRSDSRLEPFDIQTLQSALIMQLFWLLFQPRSETGSRSPPTTTAAASPHHVLPDRLSEHQQKSDICISLCWGAAGGVGYRSRRLRLLHSSLSVTHFCATACISAGFLPASPPGSCFIFIASLTLTPGSCGVRAHTLRRALLYLMNLNI